MFKKSRNTTASTPGTRNYQRLEKVMNPRTSNGLDVERMASPRVRALVATTKEWAKDVERRRGQSRLVADEDKRSS